MIEQIVISGDWLWLLFVYAVLYVLCGLVRILYPNNYIKKAIAGKVNLHDNITILLGVFTLVFGMYVIAYILGWIS